MEYGERGEVIVLLGSPLIRSRSYVPAARAMSESSRVIVLDLPGAGKSDALQRPWSDEEYAEWLNHAFDSLGIRNAVIVGHSNSGPIALWFAAKYPSRVTCLMLIDSIGASMRVSLWRSFFARMLTSLRELRFTFRALPDLFFNIIVHPRTFFYQMIRSSSADLLPVAARVRVPVVLAWGAKDRTMPLRSLRRFQSVLPRANLVVNEWGDHDWLVEHAAEFAEMVRYYLGSDSQNEVTRFSKRA